MGRIEIDLFDTPEGRQLGVTPKSWVPEVNTYGGWYGRLARPGDVKLAFVAERVNENVVAPDWPPLYGGVSGMYLWKAIASAGLHPHDCYYTNAFKPETVIDDLRAEMQQEVLPDEVVALGRKASERLWYAGISHVAIPHPAFWKRFRFSDDDPKANIHTPSARGGLRYYARLIREALS